MLPLRPNSETGFLESNRAFTFDSDRKVRFLELAREYVERKLMPNAPKICKVIGIGSRTFYTHLQSDEKFSEAWEEILDDCEGNLVDVMFENGQKPSGYMDRITWLRAHRPGRWNPDLKLRVSADLAQTKGAIDAARNVFDAEIVPNLPSIAQQNDEKH